MSTTVKWLFNKYEIKTIHKVPWGTLVGSQDEGIYIVSLSPDPEQNLGIIQKPSIDTKLLLEWFSRVPKFTVDGIKNFKILKARLNEFWLPDESILYIGKASKRKNGEALGNRINEYYSTKLGAGSPHSGGQWIKTLSNLKSCFVYYGAVSDASVVEDRMLADFMQNVSLELNDNLRDPSLPLPFANIRYNGTDKNHGMENQRL